MIKLKTFVVNSFQENTFLIWDDKTGETVIVDAGCYEEHEFNTVENFISENNLKLTGMLNTHCHIDHVLAVPYFRKKYNLEFRAHKEELPIARNAHLMGTIFGLKTEPFPDIDTFIEHKEEVRIGDSYLTAIHVPGHSMGSLAYYNEEAGLVITGDALFEGSIGRTDLPGGDYDLLINSIKNNLLVLLRKTEVYPGHGPSSTIGAEIDSNPFL